MGHKNELGNEGKECLKNMDRFTFEYKSTDYFSMIDKGRKSIGW